MTWRRARLATRGVFFLVGLQFGTWAARIPDVARDLSLDGGELTVAFLSLEGAAVAGLWLGSAVTSRMGSGPALRWSLPAFGACMAALGVVPDLLTLALAIALFAATNSVIDVAMNAHGVALERGLDRPLLSGLHAIHPLGGIAGAGLGALAAHFGIGRAGHFAVIGAITIAAAIPLGRLLLPGGTDQAKPTASRPSLSNGWTPRLLFLGALAFCITFADGTAQNWSAVYLDRDLDADPGLAGSVVMAYLTALTAGRLAGDRLVRRFGPAAVFRAAALLGGLGLAAGVLSGGIPGGFLAFVLLGAGASVTLPIALSAAGALPGQPPARSVARVSALGYLGSFIAPAVVGNLADRTGLGHALLVPALLVLAVVPFAGHIKTRLGRASG